MRLDVRKRSLGENGLCDHAAKGKHGKAAVSDFLQLQVVHLLLASVLEEAAIQLEVTGFSSGSLKSLNKSNCSEDLKETDPEKKLSHSTLLHKGIVRSDRGEAFVSLRKRVNTKANVDSSESDKSKHSHTTMFELRLTKEVHRDEVRETERVKSNISSVAVKVGRVLQERKSWALLVIRELSGCTTCVK